MKPRFFRAALGLGLIVRPAIDTQQREGTMREFDPVVVIAEAARAWRYADRFPSDVQLAKVIVDAVE